MRVFITRASFCVLSVWLAVFIPVTISHHHHPDGLRDCDGRITVGESGSREEHTPGGPCDICARLIIPVVLDSSEGYEIHSEFRGISFACNDIPVSSQLFSRLKGRSPPTPVI